MMHDRSTFAAAYRMARVVDSKVWRTLLACAILFGLQLWCPSALQAAELPHAIDEISMSPTDPSDPNGGDDGTDLVLALHATSFGPLVLLNAPSELQRAEFESGLLSLLPVSGLQPSAP
jgi:hypothetical protein